MRRAARRSANDGSFAPGVSQWVWCTGSGQALHSPSKPPQPDWQRQRTIHAHGCWRLLVPVIFERVASNCQYAGSSRCPALSASDGGVGGADRYAVCAAPGTMISCQIPGRSFALTTGLLPAWGPRATPARLAQAFFAEADVALQAGATGAVLGGQWQKARQRVGAATRCLHNREAHPSCKC